MAFDSFNFSVCLVFFVFFVFVFSFFSFSVFDFLSFGAFVILGFDFVFCFFVF